MAKSPAVGWFWSGKLVFGHSVEGAIVTKMAAILDHSDSGRVLLPEFQVAMVPVGIVVGARDRL